MNNKIIYSNNFNFSKKFFWFNQKEFFTYIFILYFDIIHIKRIFRPNLTEKIFTFTSILHSTSIQYGKNRFIYDSS